MVFFSGQKRSGDRVCAGHSNLVGAHSRNLRMCVTTATWSGCGGAVLPIDEIVPRKNDGFRTNLDGDL